jgi:transposase-like protein
MKTTEDISLMFKDLFGETLQEMMEAEMDTTLGYGKNQTAGKQTENRRNGHSKKTVISEFGETEIAYHVTAKVSMNR